MHVVGNEIADSMDMETDQFLQDSDSEVECCSPSSSDTDSTFGSQEISNSHSVERKSIETNSNETARDSNDNFSDRDNDIDLVSGDKDAEYDGIQSQHFNAMLEMWKSSNAPAITDYSTIHSQYEIVKLPDRHGILQHYKKIRGGRLMLFGYGIEDRPYVCNGTEDNTKGGAKCLICFKTKIHLKRHVLRFHALEDPIVCSECGVSLVYFENWVDHLRKKHPAEHLRYKNREY